MQNFEHIIEEAKQAGVTVKTFCTYCVNAADGDLMMDDGSGNEFPVPICSGCVAILQEKYSEKFDK